MNYKDIQQKGFNPLYIKSEAKAIIKEIEKAESSETGFFAEDYIKEKCKNIIKFIESMKGGLI